MAQYECESRLAIGAICERMLLPALEKCLGQDVDKFVATNLSTSW